MNIRFILVAPAIAAVAAGLSLQPVLRAQQPSPAPSYAGADAFRRPGRLLALRRALEKLHASDDQKQAALAVLRNHQPAVKPLVDSLVKERIALHALYKAPAVDEAAVRAQSARVAAVEADLAVQKAYLVHDLRAVATPDQLQSLDTMEAEAETRLVEVISLINDWIAKS